MHVQGKSLEVRLPVGRVNTCAVLLGVAKSPSTWGCTILHLICISSIMSKLNVFSICLSFYIYICIFFGEFYVHEFCPFFYGTFVLFPLILMCS